MKLPIKSFWFTAAALFSPAPALAASDIDTPTKVIAAIDKFSGWAYAVLLAVAVVFIIFAAFTFLTAGESAEKVEAAKKQLIYAVIAVATAILATGIIALTKALLCTSASGC
ncbi:MAG: hypothetical protein V1696_00365 [Candidatus Jorgensenbacteria bacterium]